MSSSFDEFMREMEDEAREAGPEAEAAFFESQQRHWIGRRLFERRRELGYTQAKVAALSGINQADISKIEHAEANPTLDTLAALATALGLTLALEPVSDTARSLGTRRTLAVTTRPVIDVTPDGRLEPAATGARGADRRSTPVRVVNRRRPAASPRVDSTRLAKRRRTG